MHALKIATAALVLGWCTLAGIDISHAADKGGERASLLPLGEVAASNTSWTGAYFGVGAGYSVGDTELTAVDTGSPFAGTQISSNGWTADGRIGFDWQIPSSPIVIGVLGGYSAGDVEHDTYLGPIGVSASIEPTWYVGGRAGIVFGRTLFYGGYAYQGADASASISDGGTQVWSGSETINAHVALAGIEAVIAPQLTLGAEYSYAVYDDIKIGFGGDTHLDIDPEVHSFKVRLNWRPALR